MIKEIKVGGVKHSITLADDMVGGGLQKDSSGLVSLNVFNKPNNLNLSTGLEFTPEGELCLNIEKLAGSGLAVQGSRLSVREDIGGGSIDVNTICGSGLEVREGKLTISTGIMGSGLVMDSTSKVIDINFSSLIDNSIGGLYSSSSGLCVSVGSGITLKDKVIALDYTDAFDSDSFEQVYGPVTRLKVKVASGLEIYSGEGLKVKIAYRSSGLRLILNDNGELDVAQ